MNSNKTILFLIPYKLRKEMNKKLIIEHLQKRNRRIKGISIFFTLLSLIGITYEVTINSILTTNWLTLFSLVMNSFLFIHIYFKNTFTEDEIMNAINQYTTNEINNS